MRRRDFLHASTSAAALIVARARAAGPERGENQADNTMPFDFARLKGEAQGLALMPYRKPSDALPPALAGLDWDQWQAIRFRDERSVWAGTTCPFQVRFAHLGPRLPRPVRINLVENGRARLLAFDPSFFDYRRSGVHPQQIPKTLGFGGFRLHFHTDWTRDIAAFQGASYFRAVDGTRQYGLSQRGLAVDCGLPTPEEFPDFVAFYLERPAENSQKITVYALLDSPSVTGAYRFLIDAADPLVMDIDSAVYPRREIERVGIAPGTSMFFYGKNDPRRADDWRPEIHDSDGLQMWTGAGEWIWRPLVNPRGVRVNTFSDKSPRGFGLMQRERDFAQYQDDAVFYEKRPNAWVEIKGDWGAGQVVLLELPTEDETNDNIVAYWTPEDKPRPGREYLYSYRLYWCRENPLGPRLGRALATRTGIGGVVGVPRTHFSWRFVIDFVGPGLESLPDDSSVTPIITASRGRVEITSARPLKSIKGWRAMFDLALTDESVEPINLRLFLSARGKALSETWLYQYVPPPVGARHL